MGKGPSGGEGRGRVGMTSDVVGNEKNVNQTINSTKENWSKLTERGAGSQVIISLSFSTEKKSEVDSANASGTQALTLRGLSNPGVLRLGEVYREAVSRYTVTGKGGQQKNDCLTFLCCVDNHLLVQDLYSMSPEGDVLTRYRRKSSRGDYNSGTI